MTQTRRKSRDVVGRSTCGAVPWCACGGDDPANGSAPWSRGARGSAIRWVAQGRTAAP